MFRCLARMRDKHLLKTTGLQPASASFNGLFWSIKSLELMVWKVMMLEPEGNNSNSFFQHLIVWEGIILKNNSTFNLEFDSFRDHIVIIHFDQRLGAAHSKCWAKYAFSMFFVQKKLIKGPALGVCSTHTLLKIYNSSICPLGNFAQRLITFFSLPLVGLNLQVWCINRSEVENCRAPGS